MLGLKLEETVWDDPEFVAAWNEIYGLDMSRAPIRPGIIFPWIDSVVSNPDGLRLIDIGCGNGNLIRHFAKAAYTQLVGLDHGSAVIRSAKESVTDMRAKFIHASATAGFPFTETGVGFDVLTSIFVVEEVPREQFSNYCQTLHALLKSGGRAFIFTNHPSNALVEDIKSSLANKPNRKFPNHQGYFDRQATAYTLSVMNTQKSVEKHAQYHHKTIADILNGFNCAGFSIQSMIEVPSGVINQDQLSRHSAKVGDVPRFAGFVFERRN